MAAPKTRPYRQEKRAATSAETRRRVVEAARELLLRGNFHDVSVEEIAAKAEVGRTTVYQQFENKQGLLQAVELAVSERAGVEQLLVVLDHADALGALHAAFEVGGSVWAREREMFRKLFGLAHVDADLRAVMDHKEQKRQALVHVLVEKLAAQRELRRGVTPERAFQVLWLLTSFATFDAACHVTGSAEAAAQLLLETCRQSLLEIPKIKAKGASRSRKV